MLLAFIILYLLVTLFIGWWASRRVKTTQDFVIAGRQLPLFIAACALFATWFGSETIMGASTEFVDNGLLGVMEDPFGAALCLFLIGAFFARPLYRMNILTFNDFFRLRFSRRAELITAIIMVPSYFGWIAAQIVAMAFILNSITGIPFLAGIAACTLIVLFYTYIGGMWAVSITDFVQTIMILLGLLMLAFQVGEQAGGFQKVIASAPEGHFRILPDGDWISVLEYFAAWITIGLGSIPQQDVFQRVMGARSAKTAVQASYLAGIMYLTIGAIPLFIGLCGTILYPELQAEDVQNMIPNLVLRHGSLFLQIMFFGALLSAILSTTSGAILAPATVIGENIIKPMYKHVSDKQLLAIMRWAVIGVAVSSAVMAGLKKNIYELVGQSSALSLVSLFIPLVAGLYWKKASDTGLLLSVVLGMAVWLPCEIIGTEIPPLLLGLSASIIGMIAGTFIRPDKSYAQFLINKEEAAL